MLAARSQGKLRVKRNARQRNLPGCAALHWGVEFQIRWGHAQQKLCPVCTWTRPFLLLPPTLLHSHSFSPIAHASKHVPQLCCFCYLVFDILCNLGTVFLARVPILPTNLVNKATSEIVLQRLSEDPHSAELSRQCL